MLKKVILYYNTLKYLQPVQIYGRIFSILKKKFNLIRLPEVPSLANTGLTPKTGFLFHDPWNSKEPLLEGSFTFLNKSEKLGFPPQWEPDTQSLLWKYNLHYFQYLHHLDKSEKEKICLDWIKNNPVGKGTGWRPYPLSLRIVNWCKNGFETDEINRSLYQQAAYLYRDLEYFHPANHYLENARALIFSGLYFNGAGESEKWLKKGIDILKEQLKFQVLGDGGYFERTTMYHALMLELILDVINILPDSDDFLKKTAVKMIHFLNDMTHPDGNITLFNDSTTEIAPSGSKLIDYAAGLGIECEDKSNGIKSYMDSGYYLVNKNDLYLAIDAGKVGPDNIPAHSHADIFSYELSYRGEQFIVDTGVYEYTAGDLRNYCRSTKAHNTVSVGGKDQVEVWGGFRLGKRDYPYDVDFRESEEKIFFRGSYDGFGKMLGAEVTHKREIEYSEKRKILEIRDFVSGNGTFSAESFIHLHPEVEITENGDEILLKRKGIEIKLSIEEGGYKIEDSFYFPEFGSRIPNKLVVISAPKLPAALKYKLELK